jgi:hypothetical protein
MKFFAKVEEIWRVICGIATVVWRGFCKVMAKIGKVLKTIGIYIYKLRGLLMVMPVIIGAVILACYNLNHLGPNVGLNLQVDGGFETVVSRGTAVLVPLGITGVCVALTVISRKPLYPWLISVFSLVLPVLIYVINMYPV